MHPWSVSPVHYWIKKPQQILVESWDPTKKGVKIRKFGNFEFK